MPFSFLQSSNIRSLGRTRATSLSLDTHAHVLPGLDNGPETLEDSIALLREMAKSGVRKVVATPHIMGDFYRNSIESICYARKLVEAELHAQKIPIALEVAAEYYLDVSFVAALETKAPLLPLDNQYLIFETSVVSVPPFLWETVALIKARGLKPVLTHPERYYYLQQNYERVLELRRQEVLFQVSILSLKSNHQPTRLLAERLILEGLATFVGSNAHNKQEWKQVTQAMDDKWSKILKEQKLIQE